MWKIQISIIMITIDDRSSGPDYGSHRLIMRLHPKFMPTQCDVAENENNFRISLQSAPRDSNIIHNLVPSVIHIRNKEK